MSSRRRTSMRTTSANAAWAIDNTTAHSVTVVILTRRRVTALRLFHNRELRGLNFERLELAAPSILVSGRHGKADDARRRAVGNDPLRDPELPLGLFLRRA